MHHEGLDEDICISPALLIPGSLIMSPPSEIIRLFTKLSSELRRPPAGGGGQEESSLVSSLTRSLNSDDQSSPTIRVLDAALSLMGFKTPEVRAAQIDCLVGTIIAVLSSSASCKVLSFGRADAELLQVGTLMLPGDRDEMIGACIDVLRSLKDHCAEGLCDALLYALVRAAVSSYTYGAGSSASCERSGGSRNAIAMLIPFLSERSLVSTDKIPLRLLSWYLDPFVLKHDISEMLQEYIRRPFLCLTEELHDRMAWRSITVCLVTSPIVFMETRALLHNWFLLTGLTSVLDLQIAIASAMLDILSRPMWWGLSMEVGLRYPFPPAYFPDKHQELLIILSGHISCGSFLDLASHIEMEIDSMTDHLDPFSSKDKIYQYNASWNADNTSLWAMLLLFPSWFYFATSLIFSARNCEDSRLSKVIYGAVETGKTDDTKLRQAAVQYISWILSPGDETHRSLVANHIQEMSRSWTMKCRSKSSYEQKFLDTQKNNTLRHSRKLRISKASVCEKVHSTAENDNIMTIRLCLKEFDALSDKFCSKPIFNVLGAAQVQQNVHVHQNLLFRRVPLGIFIWCSGDLDESVCELLLHYVVTGEILQMAEVQEKTEGYLDNNTPTLLFGDVYKRAIDGATFIFSFFDIIEDMSTLLFDNEDILANFFCQLKGKAGRYLLRCLQTLLKSRTQQFQTDGSGGIHTMMDLLRRLRRWIQQGGERFVGLEAFEHVANDLANKLATSLRV